MCAMSASSPRRAEPNRPLLVLSSNHGHYCDKLAHTPQSNTTEPDKHNAA